MKLTKVTRDFARRGRALDDVSFELRKAEFVFLTGHSGSGKSTTLRLLHLADRPTSGEVRICGFSSDLTSDREIWKLRRRVGMVFQDFRLLPGRTARENVEFALEVTGASRSEILPRANRLLAQVGLSAKGGALAEELSGGERQRVAVARALVNEPQVLLADEPTGNLDERASRGIMELFRELNASGMAVLMATHDLELIRAYPAIRTLELSEGRLVFDSAASPASTTGGS
ncbi:MAG: ATP-binding cassette domain-containing protein [Gemmatimonadales bacterium]|nr:MAG: ATP-binding cassette domain-containing protein [Gemmatimonadales bacterium]